MIRLAGVQDFIRPEMIPALHRRLLPTLLLLLAQLPAPADTPPADTAPAAATAPSAAPPPPAPFPGGPAANEAAPALQPAREAPPPAEGTRAPPPAAPAPQGASLPFAHETRPAAAAAPPPVLSWFHRHRHRGQQAWVAAANPLAVEAGLEILAKGGRAIDAAVAVQAMLGLVEPQSSGIAGGAFLMYYDAHTGKVSALDGREKAPEGAPADMFLDEHGKPLPFFEAVRSGRSTGVPGAIAMLAAAHKKLGALRWKALFDPAIRAASQGFRVPARLAMFLGEGSPFPPTTEVRTLFSRPDGETVQEGDQFQNPEYAHTLQRIALEGPRALYEGVDRGRHRPRHPPAPAPRHDDPQGPQLLPRASGPSRCAGRTAATRCACRRRPRAAFRCCRCCRCSSTPTSPTRDLARIRSPGSCSRRRAGSCTPTATVTLPIRTSCRCRSSGCSIPPTCGCARS